MPPVSNKPTLKSNTVPSNKPQPAAAPAKPQAPSPKAAPAKPQAPVAPKPAAPPQAPAQKKPGPPAPSNKPQPAAAPAKPQAPVAPKPAPSAPVAPQKAMPQAPSKPTSGPGAFDINQIKMMLLNDDDFLDKLAAKVVERVPQAPEAEEADSTSDDIYSDYRDDAGSLDGTLVYENVMNFTIEQLDGLPGEIEGFSFPANVKGLVPKRNFFKKWLEENIGSDEEAEQTDDGSGEWFQNADTSEWCHKIPVEELSGGEIVYLTKDKGDETFVWFNGVVIADDDGTVVHQDETGDRYISVKTSVTKDTIAHVKALYPATEHSKIKVGSEAVLTYYPDLALDRQEFDFAGRVEEVE